MSLHIANNTSLSPQTTFDFNTGHAILFRDFLIMNNKDVKFGGSVDGQFLLDFFRYIIQKEQEVELEELGFDRQSHRFFDWFNGHKCWNGNFLYQFGIPFGK